MSALKIESSPASKSRKSFAGFAGTTHEQQRGLVEIEEHRAAMLRRKMKSCVSPISTLLGIEDSRLDFQDLMLSVPVG
jgi:hypothetical protein